MPVRNFSSKAISSHFLSEKMTQFPKFCHFTVFV